jgi:hypothetical protein
VIRAAIWLMSARAGRFSLMLPKLANSWELVSPMTVGPKTTIVVVGEV